VASSQGGFFKRSDNSGSSFENKIFSIQKAFKWTSKIEIVNGAGQDVGFDLFRVFLCFEISENFANYHGVVEISVIKVHIG
jgi:hypothetical protein